MSALLRRLNKPEYLFQPAAVMRRLRARDETPVRWVPLPWDLAIEVDARETIGRSLAHRGLFEMAVVETLFRLIDPGDFVLDVGANIGFMTAAAAASHANVAVIALEPHPRIFARLARNVDRWAGQRPELGKRIHLIEAAASDREGTSVLRIPNSFDGNQGIASLAHTAAAGQQEVSVRTLTLDRLIEAEGQKVGLLKIDVEGHELAALHGADTALRRGLIRDIVFEDYGGFDSEVSRLLLGHGYAIFSLAKLPWGPRLYDQRHAGRAAQVSYDSPNFLATRDARRAKERMSALGYRCVRSSEVRG